VLQPVRVEYGILRKTRERNKFWYRCAHWPLWIFVFFLSPGPLVFQLFEHGWNKNMLLWMLAVLAGTGIAGIYGQLPGVEPRPYILRFTEDKPNPLYRRICYTCAWNVVVNYALLNLAGLLVAVVAHRWILWQIYRSAYFPLAIVIWSLGALGLLPRVKRSTKGEGTERRYFYGSVWAVCAAQPVLGVLWRVLPRGSAADLTKLAVFVLVLGFMAILAMRGHLPRTRPILPGELITAD
jgi:hypothetical protein